MWDYDSIRILSGANQDITGDNKVLIVDEVYTITASASLNLKPFIKDRLPFDIVTQSIYCVCFLLTKIQCHTS